MQTIDVISNIKELIFQYKHEIRKNCKFYSHDLINNLFNHPYTKIEFLERDLKITRKTAASYLNQLVNAGLLDVVKQKNSKYYLNRPLYNIFTNG